MTNRVTGVAWAVAGLTLAVWITAFAMPLPDPRISLWDALVWAVPYMVFPMVGAAIVRHQPANRVGWLLSGIGLVQGLGVVTGSLLHRLYSEPEWHASVPWLVLLQPLGLFSSFFIALLLITFPDGHLPSPRWRWLIVGLALALAKVAVGQVVSPVSQSPGVPPSALANAALARLLDPTNSFDLNGLFYLAAASALVFRYRAGPAAIREQVKWFCLGVAALIACAIGGGVADGIFHRSDVQGYLQSAGFLALAAGIGVAVVRHRLYDVDLVISRTLAFGVLAGVVAFVYVGLVVGVGALVGHTDGSNLILSILATALVALAFNPLRVQLQEAANKVVYGRRQSPYESLATFTRGLAEGYTGDDVLARMAEALARGVRGRAAAVYLSEGGEEILAASWPGPDALPSSSPSRTEAVRYQGQDLGALAVWTQPGQSLNATEKRLVTDLTLQAGLLLRNARLAAELERRLEELLASRRRLVGAQDDERRRLERDLHDGAQHDLVALRMKLGLAEGEAAAASPRLAVLLAEVRQETADALENIRRLARGLYPPLLESQGLAAALSAHSRRMPLPVEVCMGGERFGREVETAIYFCCVEALQNTVKHAVANRAWISIDLASGRLKFEVGDDGRGFDPGEQSGGSGLQNITDRVEALGGRVRIDSGPQGTLVRGELDAASV